ncbi:TPA: hypothetical protein ACNH1J_002693 [Enterobacter hormaechei]|uniref:Ead/Ea22-like family protein n=1 Tax=Enterobacter hormaechei TaxID=158836 RepID=A0ABD7L480_9ENTR|nr:hypothetical protein [Enterobacter hormaechei]SAF42683.1 Uncharacterised protein [Enterobacter hormaechei]
MSNIDKQAVQAVADLKAGYTLGHADVEIIQQMALDAVTLLDELEASEKRIAELEAREVVLPQRYSMLHRVDFDEPYHTEMVYKQHQVLEALHDAGVNVAAAAGKGE